MIYEQYLLKVLHEPYFSEKTSVEMEKRNVVVFKVTKDATKKKRNQRSYI